MSGQLEGRAGIITGAAGGIGRSLAGAFVDEGARVAVLDVDADGAARRVRARRAGVRGRHHRRRRGRGGGGRRSRDEFGQLDFLVNNAGIRHQAAFLDHGLEEWRRTLDVNLTGAFICSQAVIRRMQPGGRVVNIASIAGVLGLKNRIAYEHDQGRDHRHDQGDGVRARREHGICVNAIGPGVIETSLTASYFEDETFANLIRENVPLGRWGQTCGPARRRGVPVWSGRGVHVRAGAVRRRRVGLGEGVLTR